MVFDTHPVLELLSCGFKHAPARDALDWAFDHALVGDQVACSVSPESLARILVSATQRIQHSQMVLWYKNCGRGRGAGSPALQPKTS